ncbi:MAG: hypothetical protein HQ589_09110 [Syntrophaceae bacterium]|nr:hypothetical protein [Syntrophaceae bacterium]
MRVLFRRSESTGSDDDIDTLLNVRWRCEVVDIYTGEFHITWCAFMYGR